MKRGSRIFAGWIAMIVATMVTSTKMAAETDKDLGECEFSQKERELAEFLVGHEEQRRETLICDPHLTQFAKDRASDMAARDYFGHVTPERNGPNELLRATGYLMPKYYVGGIANSIESILAGEGRPKRAWRLLLQSPTHRRHLLGEDSMYAKQQRFGLAYVHQPDSKYAHYWVIVIAEHGVSERPMTCTPAPPVCIVH